MTAVAQLNDLELASLLSSKICHDVIGPVGAIYNGLEVLDEDTDEQSRAYALSVIRNFTEHASAKLQYARFAFGAAGSSGAVIDLGNAEQISRGFVMTTGKHTLGWASPPGTMSKDRVKLLLNLVACGLAALPRGGEIAVGITGKLEQPRMEVRCKGVGARVPAPLQGFVSGQAPAGSLDPLTIQFYFTTRLAEVSKLRLTLRMDGPDAVFEAMPG